MKMRDVIVQGAIVAKLKSARRDEAVQEMIDALANAGAIDPSLKAKIFSSVIEREKRGSTGFGKGVAVPHVKLPGLPKMVAAVGISQGGVDFNALDKQPVYTVILLVSPSERPEEHLQAMEVVFKNLSQDTFRRFLRQAQSSDEVWQVLGEADGAQISS